MTVVIYSLCARTERQLTLPLAPSNISLDKNISVAVTVRGE
jgi:hypothetical protein